ncbi:hypothetical protein GLV94_18700 [Virgibacillus halodenitrificans]|uniref:pPIWI-associating nuclease domain-containing protein n=1 Tax=Virgibacillus halodenitrificans TaxID=1482 RepID=UPI0013681539|nr:hypothetical protein [Virgibacillus halodenitrificans]MYL47673.1 hypothetical protein [Virgibacillus halodenitrificans]
MKIFSNLTNSISSKLEKDFYIGVFQDSMTLLETPINTKFSNFATNIRELTRNLLEELAPDYQVQNCSWYEEVLNKEGKVVITRVQRMTYTIKGGLSNQFIEEELEIDFSQVTRKLNKVINKLNKYTHLNEKVYFSDENQGFKMVENTLVALDSFLNFISDFRSTLIFKLEERLYSKVSDALTEDVINEIDILATHYWIDGSSLGSITVSDITSDEILIDARGTVEVEHQYGSDGDFKRGDGVRFENSYPFQLSLILDINYPLEVSIQPEQIIVDNSSFFE